VTESVVFGELFTIRDPHNRIHRGSVKEGLPREGTVTEEE
jgi:hypothetical protein